MSSIIDYTDRTTCVLFGDGAGAVVLSAAEEGDPSIIDFEHEIDGAGGPALCMPAGGSRMPASHETVDQRHALRQAGRPGGVQVRGAQERRDLPPPARPARRRSGTASTCSSRIRPTAGSSRRPPSGSACRRRRWSSTSSTYGNTTAATIPLALADAVRDGPAEERQPGAAGFGRRRLHVRGDAAAVESVDRVTASQTARPVGRTIGICLAVGRRMAGTRPVTQAPADRRVQQRRREARHG